MGGRRTRSSSTTTTNQQQNTTTPGTQYGSDLLPLGTQLAGEVMGQEAFQGDRVATPGQAQQVTQWGQMPETFVPQQTATAGPLQTMVTHVDPYAQEGIDAGLLAANANQDPIAGLVQQGYGAWESLIGNLQDPSAQIARLQQEHNEAAARSNNALAATLGSAGAFGGTDQMRGATWIAEQQQQAFDDAVQRLLGENQAQAIQVALAGPQAIAGLANLSQMPAQQLSYWGGQRQANLQAAAAAGDENAQRLMNNLWQAQQLNDRNAMAQAQDDIMRWQAQYQADSAVTAQQNANTNWQTQVDQAALDNAYLNWLTQQETLQSQIANLGQIIGYGGMVPGSSTTMSGTQQTDSTSRTSGDALSTLGGIVGAAGMLMGPGGLFSGSLSALGGAGKAAGGLMGGMMSGGAGDAGASGGVQPANWLQPLQNWQTQAPAPPSFGGFTQYIPGLAPVPPVPFG